MHAYRRVDADSHVNEPPDLWTARVPERLRDRVPYQKRFDKGDAWVMEGVAEPVNFGRNARRREPEPYDTPRDAWARWEDVAETGYDPAARLRDMDLDFIDAAVVYPTPRLSQFVISQQDPELHIAMVQAFNDWMIEFCSHDPSRLGVPILLPNRGVDAALAELERVGDKPGVVGALMGSFPHGDKALKPEDDVVWHALVERGLALHTHAAIEDKPPTDSYSPERMAVSNALASLRFTQAGAMIVQFLTGGTFDRVPGLKVVLAEVDGSWVPYLKQELDHRHRRRAKGSDARLQQLPSEIIDDHFHFTYITDHHAVKLRHEIGLENLMWSTDYPHSTSDWPYSWRTIDADFSGVPEHERHAIVAGNALRLYGFKRAS